MLIHLTLLLVHTAVVFFETFFAIVITSCNGQHVDVECHKLWSLLLENAFSFVVSLTPISE